ncbi:DUF1146 family protein [Paenibacillus septentrionalis]|uniref:DUF1146 family protein n=1 Tax=Paenibacillus septentrionalis TaxID=429342 RepID=A0ABW1VAN2_9BACL
MTEGLQGLFSIIVVILSILFVWMLLAEVAWDKLLKNRNSPKSRMLQIVIAVALGYQLSSFLLQYLGFSTMLQDFVE